MRLVSFDAGDGQRFGAVEGNHVRDMTGWAGHPTLRSVLAANALPLLAAALPHARSTHALDAVTLLPPVPNPDKCICVGPGAFSSGGGGVLPDLFLRLPSSFTGHRRPLLHPQGGSLGGSVGGPVLGCAGAVVLVVGRPGRHIARNAALSHLAGVTLCAMGTVHHAAGAGALGLPGLTWDCSGSIGPWMATLAGLDLSRPMRLMLRVNGEALDGGGAGTAVPFDRLVHEISSFTALVPGDLIVVALPFFGATPWLRPGDRLEVEADGIGTLANPVESEA